MTRAPDEEDTSSSLPASSGEPGVPEESGTPAKSGEPQEPDEPGVPGVPGVSGVPGRQVRILDGVDTFLFTRGVPAQRRPRIIAAFGLLAASDRLDEEEAQPADAAAAFDAARAVLAEPGEPGEPGGPGAAPSGMNGRGPYAAATALRAALCGTSGELPAEGSGEALLLDCAQAFLVAAAAHASARAAAGNVPAATFSDLQAEWSDRSEAAARMLLAAIDVAAPDSRVNDPAVRTGDGAADLVRMLCGACTLRRFASSMRRMKSVISAGRWPLPEDASPVPAAELLDRCAASIVLQRAVDGTLLKEVRAATAQCVRLAWNGFEACDDLPDVIGRLPPAPPPALPRSTARCLCRLWLVRGHLDLLVTELWNHETLLNEPQVTSQRRLASGMAALLRIRFGPSGKAGA